MTQMELVGKPCKFCTIVSGEQPCHKIHSDNVSFVFLDTRPLFAGHCLVVPKEHCETLIDFDRGCIDAFFSTVRLITRAVEKAMDAEGSFVAINNHVSQSIPHLHVHVVPRNRGDGLRGFFWPRNNYASTEEIEDTQQKIVRAIDEIVREEGL